jgi:tetratricopeptide (TPR) repeat protein
MPFLAAGWFRYLAALLPVVGIVRTGHQVMADRFTYIPSIGLCVAAAFSAGRLVRYGRPLSLMLPPLAAGLLAVLVFLTRAQVGYWRDDVTLFGRAVSVTDGNATMHYNLANALRIRRDLDEAIYHYERALAADPGYAQARNNLAVALALGERYEEAVVQLEILRESQPDAPNVNALLEVIYERMGKSDRSGKSD